MKQNALHGRRALLLEEGILSDKWKAIQRQGLDRFERSEKTPSMRLLIALSFMVLVLSSCGPRWSGGPPNMGQTPSKKQRQQEIAHEDRGDFYYGRRYFIKKTRFWGYLREPGQPAKSSKLVIFNESFKRSPDRLPEDGPINERFGFDQNYEYKIWGNYTGRTLYEPNSNQFLPEFLLTDYKLVNPSPNWLFSPADFYHPQRITLIPR